ncbi:MAG: hypothetical protein Kow0067_16490 [Coriobacteriia bacterium]
MNNMGYGMPPQQPVPTQVDPGYVAYLEQRIVALEQRLPRTNIVSPKFWSRAWAIFGHLLAISAIIWLVMAVISTIIAIIGGAALFSSISEISSQGPIY